MGLLDDKIKPPKKEHFFRQQSHNNIIVTMSTEMDMVTCTHAAVKFLNGEMDIGLV